jgi:hypothetical protein
VIGSEKREGERERDLGWGRKNGSSSPSMAWSRCAERVALTMQEAAGSCAAVAED